jgi:hypothetical protein
MIVGSIVVVTAALLLAPGAPLAGPAAAAPQPVVSSVSPRSGTIGTRVTITGSGFDYGCTGGQSGHVFFGGVAAAGATVSAGGATAVAPSHGAGPVDVRVADCLGDFSRPRRADRYAYLAPGPRFFGLNVYGTESREATVTALLLKPRVLALRVMRVVSQGRLVFAGLVRLGHQPRGRSLIHWNFRINHRLLGPGRYQLTLHACRAGVLSAPAAPGARTLLVLKEHRVRLLRWRPRVSGDSLARTRVGNRGDLSNAQCVDLDSASPGVVVLTRPPSVRHLGSLHARAKWHS